MAESLALAPNDAEKEEADPPSNQLETTTHTLEGMDELFFYLRMVWL